MKYDFASMILETPEGEPMPTSETDKTPYTAKQALLRALLVDNDTNSKTKLERYTLFLQVRAGESDFTGPEVALLREAALAYPTFMAGPLVRFLDQKA